MSPTLPEPSTLSHAHLIRTIEGIQLEDDGVLQCEEEEVDIQLQLVRLRRQERRTPLSELDVLEKKELEMRLSLVQLHKNGTSCEDIEDQELEIEEIELIIQRLKLQRRRLQLKIDRPSTKIGLVASASSEATRATTTTTAVVAAAVVVEVETSEHSDDPTRQTIGVAVSPLDSPNTESWPKSETIHKEADEFMSGAQGPEPDTAKPNSQDDWLWDCDGIRIQSPLDTPYNDRVVPMVCDGNQEWPLSPLFLDNNRYRDLNPSKALSIDKHEDDLENESVLGSWSEQNQNRNQDENENEASVAHDSNHGPYGHVLHDARPSERRISPNFSYLSLHSSSRGSRSSEIFVLTDKSDDVASTKRGSTTHSTLTGFEEEIWARVDGAVTYLEPSEHWVESDNNHQTPETSQNNFHDKSQRRQGSTGRQSKSSTIDLRLSGAPTSSSSKTTFDFFDVQSSTSEDHESHSSEDMPQGEIVASDTIVEGASSYTRDRRFTEWSSSLQQRPVEPKPGHRMVNEHDAHPDANSKAGDRFSFAISSQGHEQTDAEDRSSSRRHLAPWSKLRKGIWNSRNSSPGSKRTSNLFNGLSRSNDDDVSSTIDSNLCQCGSKRFPDNKCFFCWPCDGRIFCDQCWETWPLHRKQNEWLNATVAGSHEKCDPGVARKIIEALHTHGDLEQQALSHLKDSDTSWFGTGRDEDTGDTIFQDFGRYADLMAINSGGRNRSRYPGLVSFVGQTGAGKSSLIRLLIELHAPAGADPQVPVVGPNHADLPTSGDVHLYPDLQTFDTPEPLLYADCEGLDGGERVPMGARSRTNTQAIGPSAGRTQSLNKHIRKQYHTADREILWADDNTKKSREYHVRHLYPRLLYTFSDVIVFVMKNPKVIENTIEQLIKWAALALETSSNQPVLPHAIIVLNAHDNSSDPSLWDVDNSTIDLLSKNRRIVHQHHTIRAFAEFWRQRDKQVDSIEMLLLSYYSSIRVVRVPERGRPKLIEEQIGKLYREITIASKQSRESKHRVRMLLDSDELQPYLQYAFDHFCRNLERPFDFVRASFSNNPIPSNFGGNILKLAIDIMELWKDRLDAPRIFKEMSFMVASCIMIDSARHRTLGPGEKVFQAYLHHCNSAVQDFCDKHWPCEYKQSGTLGRCVNVKAGHTKGHQLSNGSVVSVGPYESEKSSQELTAFFQVAVLFNLTNLLEKLNHATAGKPHLELKAAAKIHQNDVINLFYRHLQGPQAFVSHTACYCCLMAPPEHALPCGHVICTPCAQMFGQTRGNCSVEMTECPMHHDDVDGQFQTRWPLFIKPRGAGVRILSLDGGGVRGIVELAILQSIQQNLGPRLPIQAFLDLIVGTSTGGIIALSLGAYGWSVNKCMLKFETLCRQAFTKRKDYGLPGLGYILSSWHNSRYETSPVENALKSAFGSQRHLFAGSREDIEDSVAMRRTTKVAVTTATTAGTAVLLANYNRTDDYDSAPYLFHRAEKARNEIKSWEAARATSAAPIYFKPFAHEPSGQVYADGALRYNCPIEVAYREQRLIWPDRADICPDIVLSIGTGFNRNARSMVKTTLRRKPAKGFAAGAKFLKTTITNMVHAALDSEQTWRNFVARSNWPFNLKEKYIRLNLTLDGYPPELDTVDALPSLKLSTEQQFPPNDEKIIDVSNRLLATAFYFMLDIDPTISVYEGRQRTAVTGTIECRFAPGSSEVRALGDLLKKRQRLAYNENYAQHHPYFVIQERRKESQARQLILTSERIDHMSDAGVFSLERISIEVNDSRAENEILLCFADQPSSVQLYPISGFPRCFWDEVTKVHYVNVENGVEIADSTKFAEVRNSLKRKSQFDFDAADFLKSKDPLKLFSSSAYRNPGGATSAVLQTLSERFNLTDKPLPKIPRGSTLTRYGSSPAEPDASSRHKPQYMFELEGSSIDTVPALVSPTAREYFYRQQWLKGYLDHLRSESVELSPDSANVF